MNREIQDLVISATIFASTIAGLWLIKYRIDRQSLVAQTSEIFPSITGKLAEHSEDDARQWIITCREELTFNSDEFNQQVDLIFREKFPLQNAPLSATSQDDRKMREEWYKIAESVLKKQDGFKQICLPLFNRWS
jgi:hypothetical protein